MRTLAGPAGRRPMGHARRSRPIKRASAGLSSIRAGAALAVLVSAGAIYGMSASSAFGFGQLRIDGQRYTSGADVERQLAIAPGTNLVSLRTEPLAERLRSLSTVADASVSVALPNALIVRLTERIPLLVWRVGEREFLVDRDGTLFAEVGAAPGAGRLPVMNDDRAASVSLTVGSRLDPVDLDAATRLGSLKPADVGSSTNALRLSVTDTNGFVVKSGPRGWTAVFGFYTATLRTPELIAGQVQLLRSKLVEAGEANVERVILASDTDGTWAPRESSRPSATPRP